MTRTTPFRFTVLHLRHIFFTDAPTFITHLAHNGQPGDEVYLVLAPMRQSVVQNGAISRKLSLHRVNWPSLTMIHIEKTSYVPGPVP